MSLQDAPNPPPPPPPAESLSRKIRKEPVQETVDRFWSAFSTKFPSKVHAILPKNAYAKSKAAHQPKGTVWDHGARESYDDAKKDCEEAVKKIARECRRVNMRYRDPHFDVEWDLKSRKRDCLDGLLIYPDAGRPKSVKRVHQIFDKPQFYIDGATAGDIRQGRAGDCWFLAALGALSNKKGLIEKVCVDRDDAVGVYGFVFHRDGQWIHTIVDDKLYLSVPDWDESLYEKVHWLQIPNRQDAEEEYRKSYQTGSRALYYSQSTSENEVWLPLLEKAYAKAHGDYYAIDGGFTGEAIEDLTGGVTTELFTSDILDIDKFWTDELMKVNEEFLFGCATGRFDDWQGGGSLTDRKGIQSGHAYSIMEAKEVKNERLLKLRNPWGESEWTGAWSDGSEQWTVEWMQLLNHQFGDDGIFWISYKDLLRKYQFFDRTRLFGPEWSVTQQWVSVDVPWSADYNDTKFQFTLTKATPIVIVLSQLDDRYWDGLQGQYNFSLHFRVSKHGEDDYIVRSHGNYSMTRSVSTELELDPGTYDMRMKITATRYQKRLTVEEVIRLNCKSRQEKLLQVGLSYDLAHAKGLITETEEEKERKADKQAKKEVADKAKAKEEAKKRKEQDWHRNRKQIERNRRRQQRREEHKRKKNERGSEEQRRKSEGAQVVKETSDDSGKPIDPKNDEIQLDNGKILLKDQDIELSTDFRDGPINGKLKPEETSESFETAMTEGDADSVSTHAVVGKDRQLTPPDDKPSVNSLKLESKPSATTPQSPEVASRQTMPELSKSLQDKELTAQEKIEQFNADPALKDAEVPAVKVNGENVDNQVLPTPPPSPGSLGPRPRSRSELSEPETIVTYASSFDTDLDDDYFRTEEFGNGSVVVDSSSEDEDEDLAEYSNDPWNAVCVVGLRLFTKEGDVSVKVVKPPETEDEEEAKEETPLDVDDPMKSMSDEPVSPAKDQDLGVGQSIAEKLAQKAPKPKGMVEKLEDVIAPLETQQNGASTS